MVAQINTQVFHHMLCTPERDALDSEGVQLAVATARGLEGEGDFAGAIQWLRRAVREAERQGNVVRAEDLARAASELAEKAGAEEERILAPSSAEISNANDDHVMQLVRSKRTAAPFTESPAPRSERSGAPSALHPTGDVPPLLAALISSMPPFSSRASAEILPPAATPSQHVPRPALPPPAPPAEPRSQCPNDESRPDAASASVANDNIDAGWPVEPTESMVVEKPVHAVPVGVAVVPPTNEVPEPASVAVVAPAPQSAAERPLSVSVFRAAIPVSDQRRSSFFIQRLASGQRAPAGMVEAMIVVTGESDSTIGFEATLGVAKGTAS
jgi:hypothetical protein